LSKKENRTFPNFRKDPERNTRSTNVEIRNKSDPVAVKTRCTGMSDMKDSQTPSGLAIWILAARPKTLWAAVAPVLIGTVMAFERGSVAWLPAAAALFGAVMIQIGTNFSNDYFDWKKGTDTLDRLGPLRVTQAGLVKPETMKTAFTLAFFFVACAGAYLTWRGGWPIAVIGAISILSGILYTAGPYPLGYIGMGDFFVLVFFGPVAVGGTYYVQALDMDTTVLVSGLGPGLLSVAILTVNNLRDLDEDKKAGKKTLAVRFGRNFARVEYLLCILIASAIPTSFVLLGQGHSLCLGTLAVPFLAIPSIRKVFTSQDGPTLNGVLAATGKLLLVYSIIFSVGWLV
jgi:1,4-dihydroxy-2-naphthoate octaprenyltransferase